MTELRPRPGRNMPTLQRIADYWAGRGMFPESDLRPWPHCFGCLSIVPVRAWDAASDWLDRAHLVDRVADGLDGPQNLVPLCHWCHRWQPSFEVGSDAIAWVKRGGAWGDLKRICFPCLGAPV